MGYKYYRVTKTSSGVYAFGFDSFKNASDWKKRFLTSKTKQIGSAIKYFFSANTGLIGGALIACVFSFVNSDFASYTGI